MSTFYKNPFFWLGLFCAMALGLLGSAVYGVFKGNAFEKNLAVELTARRERLENIAKYRDLVTLPLEHARGAARGVTGARAVLTSFLAKEAGVDALWVYAPSGAPRFLAVRRSELTNPSPEYLEAENRYSATSLPLSNGLWLNSKSKTWLLMRVEVPGLFSTAAWLYALVDPWARGGRGLFPVGVFPSAEEAAPVCIAWPGSGGAWGFGADGFFSLRRVFISGKPVFLAQCIAWVWIAAAWGLFFLSWAIVGRFQRRLPARPRAGRMAKAGALGTEVAQVVSQEMGPALRRMQREVHTLVRRMTRDEVQRRFSGSGFRNLQEINEKRAARTPEELEAEKALLAGITLPDGKKTALIEDPTIAKEVVFDFDLGDRIMEVPFDAEAAAEEARLEKEAKGKEDFAEGKTKLVEDDTEKRVVFDDTLSGKFDEIEAGS